MNDSRRHPLTPAGKILLVGALLLFGALLYIAFTDIFLSLPSGSYPIYYLLAPVAIVVGSLVLGVVWFLRRRGIAVLTSEIEEVRAAYESCRERKKNNKSA